MPVGTVLNIERVRAILAESHRPREGAFSFQIRVRLPRRLFLRPPTFLPLLVDTLSIFLIVALPPSKDLFPVRLIPARVIGAALFAAFLTLAFVIGNTMLAMLGAPWRLQQPMGLPAPRADGFVDPCIPSQQQHTSANNAWRGARA